MSVQLEVLQQFISETLPQVNDYTINGLQVEGKAEVKKIVFSVSQSTLLFELAAKEGADAIFVHHGFFGKNYTHIIGSLKKKLQVLLKNDISLFAYHLPLDGHTQYGHNVLLAKYAGLQTVKQIECGYMCVNQEKLSLNQISDNLSSFLDKNNKAYDMTISNINTQNKQLLPVLRNNNLIFNNSQQSNFVPANIFICSGKSFSLLQEQEKCDLFILGELGENEIVAANDRGLSVISLGHWRSEQPGIWEMMRVISEKFGVQCQYIEIPNIR